MSQSSLQTLESRHPRFAGFSAYYEKELYPWLAANEAERERLVRRMRRNFAIVLGIGAAYGLIALATGLTDSDVGIAASIFVAFGIVVALIVVGQGTAKLRGQVKEKLIGGLCGYFGFAYRQEPQDPGLGQFLSLQLVQRPDRQHFEDQIEGEHDGVTFSLYEAHLEDKRTRRDSDGRTETYYVTIFRGLMARFTFPKPFRGRTVVVRGGLFDGLFAGIGRKGERVKLEDPRFEKMFDVFSDDQVEARYLLTPTFMERACALEEMVGGQLQLAFDKSELLVTINGGANRFEAGTMSKSLVDETRIARMGGELAVIFQVIDELRLNAKTRT